MRRALVLLLALVCAPLAAARAASADHVVSVDPAARTGGPAPIEWTAPRRGVEAVAGASLTLAWRDLSSVHGADFEEWEAFLSLDGGASWPFRLTPHLDRGRARFVAELPPVASSHARLLLRFGDESDERELVLPFEFEIAAPRGVPISSPRRLASHLGESARPGAAGVAAWVDGPRSGAPLVLVEAAPELALHSSPGLAVARDSDLALVESAPHAPAPALRARGPEPDLSPRAPAPSPLARLDSSSAAARLSRLGRRNE